MANYSVTYLLTISHTMEVEADSYDEARQLIKEISNDSVVQDFSDNLPMDLSVDEVTVGSVYDKDDDVLLYDGIGNL